MKVVGAKMLLKLIISLLYTSMVDSVPSNCEPPLNRSNCGLRPTTVYTYNSPMAFCVPATWRGCPTANKFDYEHECLVSCTGHRGVRVMDPLPKSGNIGLASKLGLKMKPVRCDVPLNTTRCTNKTKQVYTFSNQKGACVEAIWLGCPTENMFTDFSSCQYNCHKNMNLELDRLEKYLTTELCAVPLNTSRCSEKYKKLVFKIKKRACVEALWFGCSSNIIFTDISSCRKNCHKIWDEELKRVDTNKEKTALYFPKKMNEKIDEPKKGNISDGKIIDITAKTTGCSAQLNTSRCNNYMKQVYTYSNEKGACVRALWFGCPSENIFTDIVSCKRNCLVKVDKITTDIPKTKTEKFDYEEKAYFIYKLIEANKGRDERIDDVDITIIAQDKYYLL